MICLPDHSTFQDFEKALLLAITEGAEGFGLAWIVNILNNDNSLHWIKKYSSYSQCVPTSLEYDKCNVLKLRKVCEQSELRLQKDPIKRGKLVILMMWLGPKF